MLILKDWKWIIENNSWFDKKTLLSLVMEVCFRLTFYMFIAILIKYFGLLLSLERKWVRGRSGKVSVAKSGLFPRSFQHSLSQPTLPLTISLNPLYLSQTLLTNSTPHSRSQPTSSLTLLTLPLTLSSHSYPHWFF